MVSGSGELRRTPVEPRTGTLRVPGQSVSASSPVTPVVPSFSKFIYAHLPTYPTPTTGYQSS
jgi:hypothetical protein